MKIAIMYSGLLSFDLDKLLSHKKHIIDLYDTDIYLSTYFYQDNDLKILDQLHKFFNFCAVNIESFSTLEPLFVEQSKAAKYIYHETKPINVLSMFYKIYQSYNTILKTKKYDIIIRHRLDTRLDQDLILDTNDQVNIPCNGDHHGGILDLFAYGNKNIMQQYCYLYQYIVDYLNHGVPLHPETLLRFHCEVNKIPINRFKLNLYLRNELFTQTAFTRSSECI